MTNATLRRVGGSTMLTIPSDILDMAHLSAGMTVDVTVERGKLVVQPARKRYKLQDLLAECEPDAPFSDEDRAWLDDDTRGNEVI